MSRRGDIKLLANPLLRESNFSFAFQLPGTNYCKRSLSYAAELYRGMAYPWIFVSHSLLII